MRRTCQVPGCYHVHAVGGRCAKHYQRARARVVHHESCACLPCHRRRVAFLSMAEREEWAGRREAVREAL